MLKRVVIWGSKEQYFVIGQKLTLNFSYWDQQIWEVTELEQEEDKPTIRRAVEQG